MLTLAAAHYGSHDHEPGILGLLQHPRYDLINTLFFYNCACFRVVGDSYAGVEQP